MNSKKWNVQTHNVVDIIHGVIPYNGIEMKIIENPLFARLHRVLQSSLVYMTYPSNKVHRYEHSLGVMHLSGLFFYFAIRNSERTSITRLFTEVVDELSSMYNDEREILPFPYYAKTCSDIDFKEMCMGIESGEGVKEDELYYSNTLYRDNTPSNIPKYRIFYILFEAIRLVGLLHDLGHLPYSHVSEHALKRLNKLVSAEINDGDITGEKLKNFNSFVSIMKEYISSSTEIHEKIGNRLTKKILSDIYEDSNKKNLEENFFLASVFNTTCLILNSDSGIFKDLHGIVDGIIDSDRMDYTCRDLYCAGVSKEFPRFERIFNTVSIHYSREPYVPGDDEEKDIPKERSAQEREKCFFAFNSKAIGQIELLLQRRFEDFANINYHHSVHKHELLLKQIMVILGQNCLDDSNNAEASSNRLPLKLSAVWNAMEAVSSNKSVEILFSQLDDEWLNTLLRQYYFDTYGSTYRDELLNHNKTEWNMLDELITGRKHYYSLFKRRGGFARFDNIFGDTILSIEPETKFPESRRESAFSSYIKNAKISFADFYERANEKLEEWSKSKEAESVNILHCIVDENDFSIGIKARECHNILLLSSINRENTASLYEQSLIREKLDMQKSLFPPFHIFYLPSYDTELSRYKPVDETQLSKFIARILIDTISELKKEDEKKREQERLTKTANVG